MAAREITSRGRLASVATGAGTVTYRYNAMEQRAYKAGTPVPTGAAYFIYDESGRILGEYDANGIAVYETVYLAGAPVAILKTSGTAGGNSLAVSAYHVYTDHLGTPRVVTRGSDEAISGGGIRPMRLAARDRTRTRMGWGHLC